MELVEAALLGIVQGLTEFLPVSSSAHLILVPWFFGWKPEGLTFDVSLHLGTAVAVLAYFWREWVGLAAATIRGLAEKKPFSDATRRLAWYLLVGILPAMVVGLAFEREVEEFLRSPLISVVTLIVFAMYLYCAERRGSQNRVLEQLSLADSIWIGISQSLALVPGVSRSGVTIGTGLLRNLDRFSAAKFSFLLATPVIVGAALLEGWHLFQALYNPSVFSGPPGIAGPVVVHWDVLAVGVLSAAVTGFFCIRYFLRFLQTRSLLPFVVYRLILAVVVLTFYLTNRV